MEKATYTLVKNTQEKGIDWQIQSVTPAGLGKNLFLNLKIPVEDNSYEGKFGYKSHFTLKQNVSKFIGDIILVTGPTLTGCLSLKGNQHKKVLAIHFCHKYDDQNPLRWNLFYRYFGNDYDRIVCHSPYLLEQTKEIAPYLSHKLCLINNSTQLQTLTTKAQKEIALTKLGIPINSLIIGNAGWLIERKRFDIFLEVCAKVHQSKHNVFCLIAGDGPLREDLEELAINLGINEKVKFIGWQEDISTFYQAIDLLLFNSNSDAFGRTVMEAMGYGIPVIASVLEGGTDSILKHQENGFLITKHDVNQLAEYCLKLMNEPDFYHKFQLASREAIRKYFSDELYIHEYLKLFNEVLNF